LIFFCDGDDVGVIGGGGVDCDYEEEDEEEMEAKRISIN
jgi:hypothetical protein